MCHPFLFIRSYCCIQRTSNSRNFTETSQVLMPTIVKQSIACSNKKHSMYVALTKFLFFFQRSLFAGLLIYEINDFKCYEMKTKYKSKQVFFCHVSVTLIFAWEKKIVGSCWNCRQSKISNEIMIALWMCLCNVSIKNLAKVFKSTIIFLMSGFCTSFAPKRQ